MKDPREIEEAEFRELHQKLTQLEPTSYKYCLKYGYGVQMQDLLELECWACPNYQENCDPL